LRASRKRNRSRVVALRPETPELKPQKPAPVAPTFVDLNQRYNVLLAAVILRQSVAKAWIDIRRGGLKVIRDGSRVYVPGSELIRRSTLPTA
jgi:hypothetical protein